MIARGDPTCPQTGIYAAALGGAALAGKCSSSRHRRCPRGLLVERRRRATRRLDELDHRIKAIDARLRTLEPASNPEIAEAERLSAERHELVEQAAACFMELDELEEPEEGSDEPCGEASDKEP